MLSHPYTIWDIFTPLAEPPPESLNDYLQERYPDDDPGELCEWMRTIVREQGLGHMMSDPYAWYFQGQSQTPDLQSFTKDGMESFFDSWMKCRLPKGRDQDVWDDMWLCIQAWRARRQRDKQLLHLYVCVTSLASVLMMLLLGIDPGRNWLLTFTIILTMNIGLWMIWEAMIRPFLDYCLDLYRTVEVEIVVDWEGLWDDILYYMYGRLPS